MEIQTLSDQDRSSISNGIRSLLGINRRGSFFFQRRELEMIYLTLIKQKEDIENLRQTVSKATNILRQNGITLL